PRQISREHQANGLLRGLQPPSGVQARGELEADFVAADLVSDRSYFLQSHQTGSLSGIELLQPGADEDSILTRQRNQVSDGAEGHEIEEWAHVECVCSRQSGLPAMLEQPVRKLE